MIFHPKTKAHSVGKLQKYTQKKLYKVNINDNKRLKQQ